MRAGSSAFDASLVEPCRLDLGELVPHESAELQRSYSLTYWCVVPAGGVAALKEALVVAGPIVIASRV